MTGKTLYQPRCGSGQIGIGAGDGRRSGEARRLTDASKQLLQGLPRGGARGLGELAADIPVGGYRQRELAQPADESTRDSPAVAASRIDRKTPGTPVKPSRRGSGLSSMACANGLTP